jgi:hypothetical protein
MFASEKIQVLKMEKPGVFPEEEEGKLVVQVGGLN